MIRSTGGLFPVPCLALILLAGPASVADGPADPAAAARAAPRVSEVETVRLVLLPTVVTNRRGKPAKNLTQQDFRLFEQDAPQSIDYFATEADAPVSLAFLLDLSGSMREQQRLEWAKGAIRTFVEALDADDRFGLIGFADEQVTWITEFTRDREEFLERLDVQEAYGRTALYDALAASPQLVDEGVRGRKAIVLVTDGVDNASELPVLQAVWIARRVKVPIYTLGFVPLEPKLMPRRARDSVWVLDRFCSETGGSIFTIHDRRDLDRAIARVESELRFQYVIGYHPTAADRDGSFRSLRLETGRSGLRVRTRRGYYADP